MTPQLLIPAVLLASLFAIACIYAMLYKKVPRGIALVRTGLSGRKVIIDGGCLRLPVFHEVRAVNLATVQLTVRRHGEDALITKDSMRVDVTVDFYVSVREDHDAVAQAARTLDDRTFDPVRLREMIEGKLVDALRAVAATQNMMALHENRQEFVQEVQSIVSNDLAKNGLQLESVSLTGLDQTSTESLDPNNTFNATALRTIAGIVAEQTEKRAEAEANAKIAEEREAARADEETIRNRERVERSEIDKERSVAVYRSESEAESRKAAIASNQAAETAELEKHEALRAREIERDRKLKISEQEQKIAVAEKSEAESEAQARAEEARKSRVVAEEAVRTAQEQAAAERAKEVAVVKAQEDAEVEATRVRVAAEARREETEQDAHGRRNAAELDKVAAEFEAEASREQKRAEADGIRAVNEAKNTLDPRLIELEERLRELDLAPHVVRELVKPFAGVGDNMRSVFVHGLGGSGGGNGGGGDETAPTAGGSRSVIEDLFSQVMNFSVSQPALRQIGESIGVDLEEALRTGAVRSGRAQGEQRGEAGEAAKPRANGGMQPVDDASPGGVDSGGDGSVSAY